MYFMSFFASAKCLDRILRFLFHARNFPGKNHPPMPKKQGRTVLNLLFQIKARVIGIEILRVQFIGHEPERFAEQGNV